MPCAETKPVEDTRFTAETVEVEAEPQSCTVLLVEDDALILLTTAEMLRDLGHEVVEAYSGAEALACLRSGKQIDIVVTDQGMPNMTGLQLAEQIRATWPSLPIILATGYAGLPKRVTLQLPRLSKPYQQEEIAAAITRLLKRTGGRDEKDRAKLMLAAIDHPNAEAATF